jgi:hypothetical protein
MIPAATAFFGGRPGRAPKILEELRIAATKDTPTTTEILELVSRLQASVYRAEGSGVLLVIDELGKFLEYEARHRGATDVFLLQALAEHSVRNNEIPLVLVVLLHQAFEMYAQNLGEQLKNEWKKVQGRFECISFLETTEQTLRVMNAAIIGDLPKSLSKKVAQEATAIARSLGELGALPQGLGSKDAGELFSNCYPLHPVSLLLLPILCQRVAQNERTLFSYLGSQEPYGFLDFLNRSKDDGIQWIRPHEIYEYFILNQPGLISDQTTHRKWAEVTTALERLGDAPCQEIELLKTIGLLNIIGSQGGLKASEDILDLCYSSASHNVSQLKGAARGLADKSVITFRRYSGEYRVWQGSDFDLEEALRDQKSQVGRVDIADVLNELRPLSPIIARRHAIATGTLRYYTPVFVSGQMSGRIGSTETPTVFVCLAENSEEIESLREQLCALGEAHTFGVVYENGALIREAVTEVLALQRVQRYSSELANDPVAQRELRDRLMSASRVEKDLVSAIFEEPGRLEWIIAGSQQKISNKRELQLRLSALFDRVYCLSPIIRNELINRERPSATAMAGRKKLLLAMLENFGHEDLGIDKFPAEKAMYRAVLRATGLHTDSERGWSFRAPPEGIRDEFRMRKVWDVVITRLGQTKESPASFATLYEILAKPPFGIKAGVMPVIMLAIYQALSEELALCENGQFVPFMTQEVLESVLKSPATFTLQRFQLDSVKEELFGQYAKAISDETPENANLISVLQPLAKLMVGLPDYTKQTKRVSAEAIAVRDLFFASKTPVDMVFSGLPKALGVELAMDGNDSKKFEIFAEKFKSTLAELRVAYHALLSDITEMLKVAFALDPKLGLDEVRSVLRGRCSGLDTYTIDPQCMAFIGRLLDAYGDETQWLISLASFLARKPPEKWIDDDLDAAKYRLTELTSRIRDLRQLQLHYEDARTAKHGDFEASLIRIISTRDGERQALVTLDEQGRNAVLDRALEVRKLLESLPNDELKLAALAQAVKDLISPVENKSGNGDVTEKNTDKKGAA